MINSRYLTQKDASGIASGYDGWFPRFNEGANKQGAHVLFDGQYGSTGKGLLADFLAQTFSSDIHGVTTSAGPNSGHTSYRGDTKVVLHQLPTAGVVLRSMCHPVQIFINAGAVVDVDKLIKEVDDYIGNTDPVFVHPNAAYITKHNIDEDVSKIGGTQQGVGPSLMKKISRDVKTDICTVGERISRDGFITDIPDIHTGNWLVEVAQGWSLGINQPFYPYVTSRECSVAQALADFGVAPKSLCKSIVSLRTFPIRVAGKSGGWYPDQREIAWGDIHQKPELTSTTQKERRIATWSRKQYIDMLMANEPDAIFINFLNYLPDYEQDNFVLDNIFRPYYEVMGRHPDFVLGGYGAKSADVKLLEAHS